MSFVKRLAVIAMVATLASVAAAEPVERIMTRDGILYVSGGIGVASQERLKRLEPQFNLKLVFTMTGGQFLADVRVVLKDKAGKLRLEHVTDGPIFMARVPAGHYTVSATYRGSTRSRSIEVAGTLRTAYFRWSGDAGITTAAPAPAPAPALGGSGTAARQGARPGAAIPFISGGIGADAIAELKAKEPQYNLKLVFSLIEGNYVADVNVVLKSATGAVVLEHLADGPIFLARLPDGNYTAAVTYRGSTQTRPIKVGEKLHTEYFRWPSNPETDLPVSRWLEPGAGQ